MSVLYPELVGKEQFHAVSKSHNMHGWSVRLRKSKKNQSASLTFESFKASCTFALTLGQLRFLNEMIGECITTMESIEEESK